MEGMGRKKINKVILRRTSDKLAKELNRIKIARILNGVDKKMSYDSELTEMLVNAPSWRYVKRELETYPKKEDLK